MAVVKPDPLPARIYDAETGAVLDPQTGEDISIDRFAIGDEADLLEPGQPSQMEPCPDCDGRWAGRTNVPKAERCRTCGGRGRVGYFSLVRPDPDLPCPTITQTGGVLGAASVIHPGDDVMLREPEFLALVREARAELERIESVPEAREIAARADGWQTYARRAKLSADRANLAVLVWMLAERRAGEILLGFGFGEHGGDRRSSSAVKLETVGATKAEAHRWCQRARIPVEVYEQAAAMATLRGSWLTVRAVRNLADQLGGRRPGIELPPEPLAWNRARLDVREAIKTLCRQDARKVTERMLKDGWIRPEAVRHVAEILTDALREAGLG